MPADRTTGRLKRILVLIPWVIAHPDSTVAAVCERFDMTREHDRVDRTTVELASAGDDLLAGLRSAVDRRERLRMTYSSGGREEMTEREVDPLLVCASMGSWYLIAHDHHSGEERTFRIDRI